jgi:hypothetical protein
MKYKASSKFKGLPQKKLLTFCETVLDNLTGNPTFDKIKEIVDGELNAQVTSFNSALKACASGDHEKVALKDIAKQALLATMSRIVLEVDLIANGDKAIILAAGLEVNKTPVRNKKRQIAIVTGVTAERTLNPNEALVKWKKVNGADKYALENSSDHGASWKNGTYSNGKKVLMTDLPSKTEVMIRVCALGADNKKGPWSDPVSLFVV